MAFTIRRLGPGDEQLLATIASESPEFDLAGRSEPERPLSDADAAAYLVEPSIAHWVAESGGRVVGELLCHVLPLPQQPGPELFLYSIGIREGNRRQGVGRALVDELCRFARDAGIALIWVLADNPGAELFYEACGFTRGGENDQGVLLELKTPAED
jgi:ribosomal protein S18 acetylase RimI-like enzyme